MAELNDLSVTDASNTARFPEGQARSSVNNAARALEGILARWHKDNNGSLATGGTSTAITVTLNQSSIAAWYDGLTFAARITTTCGATPTINPTGSGALGAKSLYWAGSGVQLAANDLTSTAVAWFMYEATSDKVYVYGAPPYAINGLLTTRGDLVTRDASTPVRLAIGSASTVLRTDGTDPSWGKVAGAHIAMGSDAQGDILYYNGTAYARLAAGTSGQYLKTQGSGANPTWANLGTLGSAVALSGSATTTFSSLPAGLNYIVITFDAVSNGSTDNILVQIGDSGGLETSGYTSASSNDLGTDVSSSAGFIVHLNGNAANVVRGVLWLVRSTGNVWVSSHNGMIDQDEGIHGGGARTTLDSALDRVAVLSTASNNFDGGTVNIVYW